MIICPRCQAQNPEGMVQCGRCGYPLQRQFLPVSMPISTNNVTNGQIAPYAQQEKNIPITQQKRQNNKLSIGLLVVSILLLLSNGVLIWFYLQSREDNQRQKNAYVELQKTAFSSIVLGQINPIAGTSVNGDLPTDRVSDRVNSVPSNTPTPKVEAKSIHIGDKVTLDFVEFSLDSIEWTERINPSDTSGYYSYYSAQDDEKYLVLWGTMKNLSGDSIRFDQMKIQFEFNEKYKFSGQIEMEDDDKGGFNSIYSIKPLKQSRFIIFASIPNEIISLYDHGILTFGFDDFQHYVLSSDDFSDLDYVYHLDFSK